MKIIYDNEKYLSEKKDIKRKYFVPLMLTNAMYGIPVLVMAMVGIVVYGFITDMPYNSMRLAILFPAWGILGVLLFVIFLTSFFIRNCPSNAQYGYYSDKYEILSKKITTENHCPICLVFYKDKKGKTKSFKIELKDNGFYKELSEDVIDLTIDKNGVAHWYRSLDKHIEDLAKDVNHNALPDNIKDSFVAK